MPFSSTSNGAGDPVAEAAALAPWLQNLHLPDGTQTAPDHPLGDYPNCHWEQLRDFLPDDLSGCTALDIGCNAGFYAIELAHRGAQVTAVDHDPHALHQAHWAIARHGLQNRITLYQGRAYDLARWRSRHDVVLLLDLLNRLRYPLLALDIAARLVKRCLVLQSRSTPGPEAGITSDALSSCKARETPAHSSWPKMAGFENAFGEEARSGGTSNRAGVEAMLHSAGLEIVKRPGDTIYLCQPRAVDALGLRRNDEELEAATGGRRDGFTRFDQLNAPASVRSEPFVATAAEPAA